MLGSWDHFASASAQIDGNEWGIMLEMPEHLFGKKPLSKMQDSHRKRSWYEALLKSAMVISRKKRRQLCLLSQQQYILYLCLPGGQTSRADLTSMFVMFCVLLPGDTYPNFLGKECRSIHYLSFKYDAFLDLNQTVSILNASMFCPG